jgi:hypothetical protein
MLEVLRRISAGLIWFTGMSAIGLICGGILQGILGTEDARVAYGCWGLFSAVGLARGVQVTVTGKT